MDKIKILFEQMNLTDLEREKYHTLELIEVDVDRNKGLWVFVIKSPEVLLKTEFLYQLLLTSVFFLFYQCE